MNETEHLLTCLAEECSEVSAEVVDLILAYSETIRACGDVAKVCTKSLRFGLDDKVTLNPRGPRGTEGKANSERLVDELNDLLGVMLFLTRRGALPENWMDTTRQEAKVVKLGQFMEYARRTGALSDE
jgi:hypothetical protein